MPGSSLISWEEAVRWYRRQPGNEQAVRDNYFDLPVLPAARRFAASEEFAEMLRVLGPGSGRRVLDLGAGHGVTSFAMAAKGWRVTALEPDPSEEVGWGAIEAWRRETGFPVEILESPQVPFALADASMDAVIARQVLHHVPDLDACMRELFRVLKPDGILLTTRDHVADDEEQLQQFLANHPLQALYGGENAHPLKTYLEAFCAAGFQILDVWGPVESILNFYPGQESERRRQVRELVRTDLRLPLAKISALFPHFQRRAARWAARGDRSPGRIYSILARKPGRPALATSVLAIKRWLPFPTKKRLLP